MRLQEIAAKQAILHACAFDSLAEEHRGEEDFAEPLNVEAVLQSQPPVVVEAMLEVLLTAQLVTPSRLRAALTPTMRRLDLSSLKYSAAYDGVLADLPKLCPNLESLQLQGKVGCV